MNKYAEILYGKVRSVHEDERDFDTWRSIFSPSTYWVDVTGVECKIGYVATFDPNIGLVLSPPKTEEPNGEDTHPTEEADDEGRVSVFEAVAAQEVRLVKIEETLQALKGGEGK